MNNYGLDVLQIVDALPRHDDRHRHTMKIDPEDMAKNLSLLIKTLGRENHKVALVPEEDSRIQAAYAGANYETHAISGDRGTDVMRVIRQTIKRLKSSPPKRLVLVTDDPKLVFLCESLLPDVELSVWANSATAPNELKESSHYFQPLEELLPNLKIPQIDVRIDLENIFIGLVKRGWRPNLRELVGAIHQALAKQSRGEVVSTTGYADFDELSRHHGGPNANWQRDLTLAGAESRYVVNQHGKNTADMKIANDICTVVEHSGTAGVIDVIGLATMDRDFRHVVEKVKQRGKKVIIVGLRGGLSRELETIASEVCYLDDYLTLPKPGSERPPTPQREDAAFMMHVSAWMHQNHWRYVYRDKLERQFPEFRDGIAKLIADGWLTPSLNDGRALEPNPENTAAQAAHHLARWIPDRVYFCLTRKRMPHVDSNFLARGMTLDATLVQMGVGQTRADAEFWLAAAASAGIVVPQEAPHPHSPEKRIKTWRLPERIAPEPSTPVQEPEAAAPPTAQTVRLETAFQSSSRELRELLTNGLSDAELTTLLYDNFLSVYRQVGSVAKYERIQALLEYVEPRNQGDELLAAIRRINPSLFEDRPAVPIAA